MTATGPWTSVSMPYVSDQRGDLWATEAAQHGGKGTQQLLRVEEIIAPATVAGVLGLVAGEPVVVRGRVMLFDGDPVELVESYYPASIARGTRLADSRKIPGGAVAHLCDLGHQPRHVREDVSARLATAAEQTVLQLNEPSCVLLLNRVLTTDNGLAVEASVITMAAEGRRLRYELTP